MGFYLVEEYLPGISERELLLTRERLESAVAGLAGSGDSIRYLGTTFIPEQDTSLSQFEAGSRRVVERACRRAGLRSARISEAHALTAKEET
ncbi:MAG: hypothetical protein WD249_01515 [Gaiellaceae bacterium]